MILRRVFWISVPVIVLLTGWLVIQDGTTARVTLAGHTFHAQVADTPALRAQGLSGHDTLAPDAAMLFVFPDAAVHSFWMKDMRFAIDIIWLRNGTVVDITRNARPEPEVPDIALTRYTPTSPADQVLEVVAGTVDIQEIHFGDMADIQW